MCHPASYRDGVGEGSGQHDRAGRQTLAAPCQVLRQVHERAERVTEDGGSRRGVDHLPVDGQDAAGRGEVLGLSRMGPGADEEPGRAGVVGDDVGQPEPEGGVPGVDDLDGDGDRVDRLPGRPRGQRPVEVPGQPEGDLGLDPGLRRPVEDLLALAGASCMASVRKPTIG